MICSILDKPKRNITFDRIIIHNDNNVQILTTPKDILEKVAQHYKSWTPQRHTKPLNTFPEWQKEYEPKPDILSFWYEEILNPISTEEIKQVINHRSSKSAPGRNQLPYIAYKHLNTTAIEQLTKIYNSILTTGETSREWSRGTIFPISKPKIGKIISI